MNSSNIEDFYQKHIHNFSEWIPEGIIDVDLNLLRRLDLLNFNVSSKDNHQLTRYFHVQESPEKITLINEQFVIWIIPEKANHLSVTYTLIALNRPQCPHLEIAFSTWGVYNSSHLVLRILEKFLSEIQENEDTLHALARRSKL